MRFANGWKTKNKQADKFHLQLRISLVTVIEVYFDWSDRQYRIGLFNLFVGN